MFLEISLVIAFELGPLLLLPAEEFLTILIKLWVAGQAKLICCMCGLQQTRFSQWLDDSLSRYGSYIHLYKTWLGAVGFGHSCWGSDFSPVMSPLFSRPFKFGLEVLWLGVEAHGWERSPSRSCVPIVEAPGYHRHPASTYM